MNRKTVTYAGLADLMYRRKAQGVLDKILGHIAFHCIDCKLPPLTSLVVGKGRGTPGRDMPLDPSKIDQQREKVYEFDWYDVYPPNEEELLEAFDAHMS